MEVNNKLEEISRITNRLNIVPEKLQTIISKYEKIRTKLPQLFSQKFEIPNIDYTKVNISIPNFANSKLLENLKSISEIGERIKNNPELQFAFITDLEILNLKSSEEFKQSLITDLTDEDILEKEELLNTNLLPYLENLNIHTLWLGANEVLKSNKNPDKLRHCLISIRTILEYLIDEQLAPLEKLKDDEKFKDKFKKYHEGKQELKYIKIKRADKIEYFISKIQFKTLEEFTKNEIQYVCDCYTILCNIHKPDIGITENQVRSLKVKTGITIWLLVYLNQIIEKSA